MDFESDISKNHYFELNNYRDSFEYQASGEVWQKREPTFYMKGKRWEINKDIFWYFLEMLPPMGWRRGDHEEHFYMMEYTFGYWTAKFSRSGDKYYCEHAEYKPKKESE